MIHQKFTFKAIDKLKSRKLIGQIFTEGKSFSLFPFRVVYTYPLNNKAYLQAAFSVSSRNFKKAVDRNRIKRLLREAYRLQKNSLQKILEQNKNNLAVFIIYTGTELPVYENVLHQMKGLIQRLEKIELSKDEQK